MTKVTQARQQANEGNLSPERTIELLAMMEDYLQVQAQTKLKAAVSSLTYSEVQAMVPIAKVLPNGTGEVVSTKVADAAGITRSVIVSALRKMEAAGVLDCHSLGMKGTHIKTLVPGWQEAVIKRAA